MAELDWRFSAAAGPRRRSHVNGQQRGGGALHSPPRRRPRGPRGQRPRIRGALRAPSGVVAPTERSQLRNRKLRPRRHPGGGGWGVWGALPAARRPAGEEKPARSRRSPPRRPSRGPPGGDSGHRSRRKRRRRASLRLMPGTPSYINTARKRERHRGPGAGTVGCASPLSATCCAVNGARPPSPRRTGFRDRRCASSSRATGLQAVSVRRPRTRWRRPTRQRPPSPGSRQPRGSAEAAPESDREPRRWHRWPV